MRRLSFESLVGHLPISTDLPFVDHRGRVLDHTSDHVVITRDFNSNPGLQRQSDCPHLAFDPLDSSLDDSIRA